MAEEGKVVRRPTEKKKAVASGKARKRGFLQKIADYYIPEDVSNIPEHIMYSFFIPAIFDAMCEAITNGVEMLFHGGDGYRRNGKKRKFDDPLGYNRVSKKGTKTSIRDEDDERVSGIDIFIEGGIVEVKKFLSILDEDIEEFDWISVSDVYSRAHIKMNYAKQAAYDKYGWTTLDDVTYRQTWDYAKDEDGKNVRVKGYVIHFPRPTIQM
jgi:hypothetical protein